MKDKQVHDDMWRQSQMTILGLLYVYGEVIDLSLSMFFFRKIKPSLIVAAIDFGTTFSGCAFSFLHDLKTDPSKISAPTWNEGIGGRVSLKTSTSVLFEPTRKLHSFGYDAEEKYLTLVDNKEHHNWFYFSRFKMMLYNNKVNI